MSGDFQAFQKSSSQAAEKILGLIERFGVVPIFSHIDADGIAAGSILAKAVHRAGGHFNLRIIKRVDEALVSEILGSGLKACVFTEIGSGYLDLLGRIPEAGVELVVIDHHKPVEFSHPHLTHVNPCLNGFDGAKEVSGAGVTYFVAKGMSEKNTDLSALAVLGALGDMQDKNSSRSLHGLNQLIVDDARGSEMLEVSTDLLFYGRETRPVHLSIATTMNPYIPGLTGQEDRCRGFLANLGIPLKEDGRWRTLADLTFEEKRKIFSELTRYLASRGYSSERIFSLIGAVYVLVREDKGTPLRDAREFASLINACAKQDRPSVGIALCLGERGEALQEAQSIYGEYRRSIARYMDAIFESPGRRRELGHITVLMCEGIVEENLLSPIATIASASGLINPAKPMVALTHTAEGEVKVSARASETLVEAGLHLGVIMQRAAEKVNGRGGGHNVAAGATVPKAATEEFIAAVDGLVGEELGPRAP